MTSPPSRNANPFATCWTRPGALPCLASSSASVEGVLARLESAGWRGQIVGPHGVGKSTLMMALARLLSGRGLSVACCDLSRGGEPSAPSRDAVLMVEGFERLRRGERNACLRRWRTRSRGFVVTTHRPLRSFWQPLAVVATLRPDLELLDRLYDLLTARRATPVTREEARRAFIRHDGRLRDVWFDLYNRHERLTRDERTATVQVAYSVPEAVG